jgi:hypothetical protein
MPKLAWNQLLVGLALILVAFLAVGNAYASSPTVSPNTNVFVAADLTRDPSGSNSAPSELFVVLQADGSPNHLMGALFIFDPANSCKLNLPAVVVMTGTLFTNRTAGTQILNFTGYTPPDPCLRLTEGLVRLNVGGAFEPPDPCVLKLPGGSGTFVGVTSRFIVAITTTTTSSSTLPP